MELHEYQQSFKAFIEGLVNTTYNTFYQRTEDGIERRGRVRLGPRDTRIMGEDAIHAVDVPPDGPAGAIHVYGGDLTVVERSEFDPMTREERPFDWEKSERRFAEMNIRWLARTR